jgi:hypothetical protein
MQTGSKSPEYFGSCYQKGRFTERTSLVSWFFVRNLSRLKRWRS